MSMLDSRTIIGLIGLAGTIGISGIVFIFLLWRGDTIAQHRMYRWLLIRRTSVVVYAVICYILVFTILGLLKFQSYNMGMLDLGNFDQSLWNTLQGRLMYFTYDGWGPNVSLFVIHIEPIHLLVAPLYLLWSDVRLILILQTLVVASGALPVYWLARHHFPDRLVAVVFPVLYLLFPTVQYANLFDYHGDTLAMAFLPFVFWYLSTRRLYPYLIFLVLAIMCKEYVALLLLALGVYACCIEGVRRFGVITIVISLVWIFGVNTGLHYVFAGQATPFIAPREFEIGRTPVGILTSLWNAPIAFIQNTISLSTIGTTLLLLVPTGFLALAGYRMLWVGLPIYGGLMLFSTEFTIQSHHPATLVSVIVVAAIFGAVTMQRWVGRLPDRFRKFKVRFPGALTGYLLSAAVCANVFLSPSPISWQFWAPDGHGHGRYYYRSLYRYHITDHDRAADRMAKMIPTEAVLCVSGHLAAHLTHRESCYIFPTPDGIRTADYIFVDIIETYMGDHGLVAQEMTQREEAHRVITQLMTDPQFSLVAYEDGLFLFKRGQSENPGIHFAIEETPADSVQKIRTLSPGIDLIAYDIRRQSAGFATFTATWKVTQRLEEPLCIVTVLQKGDQIHRIVHIPSLIIEGTQTWQAGNTYMEEFTIPLPPEWDLNGVEREIRLYKIPRNDAMFFREGVMVGRLSL